MYGDRLFCLLSIDQNIFLSSNFRRQFAAVVETIDSEARMLMFKFRFLSLLLVTSHEILHLIVQLFPHASEDSYNNIIIASHRLL